MKKLLFFLAIMLVVVGCTTTKLTTKTDVKTKLEAKLDINQTKDSTHAVDSTVLLVDKGITSNVTTVRTVETVWSKPDSVGKQFPEKTIVTDMINNTKKEANLGTKVTVNTVDENKTTLSDKSDNKSDTKANTVETKTSGFKLPTLIGLGFLLGFASLAVFVYNRLKR